MKVVYVAGPYRADTEIGVLENIRRAEQAAVDVWKMGAAVICPHKNTAFFGGICGDEVFLRGYLDIVRRCDAVYMLEGWQESPGSRAEQAAALLLGIPVFESLADVREFIER
jgi:hypothetical protein